MSLQASEFFLNLRTVYLAELDDLRTDTEGRNVLNKRLAEKRRELGFLAQMLESSPEMVAVVLHQAFRFPSPKTMEHLLAQDGEDLPDWEQIQDSIEVAPWAQPLVQTLLQEPRGAWFLTLAAALEYLLNRPLSAAERAQWEDEDEDGLSDHDTEREHRHDDHRTEDHDEEEIEARAREEAGNDWLAEQGFDRKE